MQSPSSIDSSSFPNTSPFATICPSCFKTQQFAVTGTEFKTADRVANPMPHIPKKNFFFLHFRKPKFITNKTWHHNKTHLNQGFGIN